MTFLIFEKIEEIVEKAQKNVQKEVLRAGEDAAREVGIIGIPKEVLELLGELKFRTSYGQNVLKHSTEMAHIAGIIAEQLGANSFLIKPARFRTLVEMLELERDKWLPSMLPMIARTGRPSAAVFVEATGRG